MNDSSTNKFNLSVKRLTLLEKLARQEGLISPSVSAIPRRNKAGSIPLSFAQERLWFLDQLDPGSSAYNIPLAVRLTGNLNVAALECSLSEILRRHEVLRTTFVVENDQPVQVITPAGTFTLPRIDLDVLPEGQREADVRRRAGEEASRLFDLAAGPLMRATLLRLNAQEHVVLLTVHHIVSDGWSMGILCRELSALYEAFSKGNPSPLPDLPIQYADFTIWQRQWLQRERLEEQLSYWKKQLGGDLPVLDLPTDYSRPTVQTYRGGHCVQRLSRELSSALNVLSQRAGNTLFMMMLVAFNILLHRLSAQDDIIVGTPIAGRNRFETEGLIGLFINTLVMRTDLSGNPTFLDVLGRVGKVAVEAYTHQDVPFEKLVEKLQPERDLSRTPLFQVMLNMLNLSHDSFELPDLRAEIISPTEEDSKFDLTLYVSPHDDGMLLDLVYNADLFEDMRMTEMLEQMRYLLEQIVANPEKSIHLYSLRTSRSASFIPDPGAALAEPGYPTVTSMFLSQVDRSPNHPVVSHNGQVWTYKQLSESVYHLAGVLRNGGIERGEVVAVTGPRSFGIISGIAAVLLSGGVLLTIDENLPAGRKRLMCQEAKAKCLLHIGEWQRDSHWCDDLFPLSIVAVDKDRGLACDIEKSSVPALAVLPELSPDDAAYIFFTSGTTGVPKGVVGCHKGLSHFLAWQRDTFAVGFSDRCAQLTNLSFDVVLRDIFLPLVSGACLCLPDESEGPVSDRVLSWLDREGITLLHTVPSVAQSWMGSIPTGITLGSLRNVFFAGEPLRESLLRKWRDAFPDSGQLVNLYGPTETTLAKCFYVLPSEIRPGIQPVGRPLPETQALVLSQNGQLCGTGEVGEIVLRTPFRTLGYINNPEEQQKRFLRNHFRDDSNDVVYHTGDLGRYRPDGLLTILGRLDDQVKIRGIRIEPAEVATILERHPHVRSAVVTARKNSHGEYFLAAYIVPSRHGTIAVSELRSYLREHFAEYMIPSAFVMMDSLPLTPNGKVDRKALPIPEAGRAEMAESFVAPHTPIEEILAGIWCDVLGLKEVGIHANFFDLGGHSLLATQVMSRLRKAFQVEMPLRSLFEMPTIEGLALLIAQSQADDADPEEMDRLLAELEGSASYTVSESGDIEDERYE